MMINDIKGDEIVAECYRCPYTLKVKRKYGKTTHCILEPTKMDVSFYCQDEHKDESNELCPFICEGTRIPDIDYTFYETEFLKVPREEDTIPIGSKWRHFKGYILTIISVATHTETNEVLVIYQCEDPNDVNYTPSIWARPINMFFDELDKDEYPNVTQKYRIERIE